ncbi:MAG: hypothetical protein ACKO37_01650 [Vampirovibrionales bacterium]
MVSGVAKGPFTKVPSHTPTQETSSLVTHRDKGTAQHPLSFIIGATVVAGSIVLGTKVTDVNRYATQVLRTAMKTTRWQKDPLGYGIARTVVDTQTVMDEIKTLMRIVRGFRR